MKPILYLDVDGVLWVPERLTTRKPAPGLRDFMNFILLHYEVRWCTSWAISGTMSPTNLEYLSEITELPVELWLQVQPSLPWDNFKTEAIDWKEIDAGRPFVWVEDGLLPEEEEILHERSIYDWFYYTNVLEDKTALLKTWGELIKLESTWIDGVERRLLGKSNETFKYPLARGGKCMTCGTKIPPDADTYAKNHHVYCSYKCIPKE